MLAYAKKLILRLTATHVVIARMADGREVMHLARSYADALEWMRCYPASESCVVFERFAGFTALRAVAWRFGHECC